MRSNKILRTVYESLPENIRQAYLNYRARPVLKRYNVSPHGRAHTYNVLNSLQNKYANQRVVIMGNGPSLKNSNWSILKNEITIGLNRINILFEEMQFIPTFHVCVKDLVLEQFSEEQLAIPSIKIFDWKSMETRVKTVNSKVILIPALPGSAFHTNIADGWSTGYTVTYAAMQLAYYLGFKQVVLIGVDHSFATKGPATRDVVSSGNDPNHFDPNYFGKGVKWQLPDLAGSERSYQMAKTNFETRGGEIVDCTEGGKLKIFRKAKLTDILV